jgi:hypothetical protein
MKCELGCYTNSLRQTVTRAGEWFLHSGIQESDGGVARYYRADRGSNLPVSTEITGYTLSALVYLHSIATDERRVFLNHAVAAANYLSRRAWNASTRTMPFELDPAAFTYFFDCGIIARGLLAGWRATGNEEYLAVALGLGEAMACDFAARNEYHPILSLPDKRPVERDELRWSQSSGCYQLKSAMAWWDLAEATGEQRFRALYDEVLESSLSSWSGFLPGHPERTKVMDRLHAVLYFLEGLLPRATEPRCAGALRAGIESVSTYFRDLAPAFVRSDVLAQLLRIRLYADWAGAVPLDRTSARAEAERLAGFQCSDSDPRIDGGFCFGRRDGECIPHVSPVSTAFALQALALWEGHSTGEAQAHRHMLI